MEPSNSAHETAVSLGQDSHNKATKAKEAVHMDQSGSRLLSIPAELRELIWKLVLTHPGPIAAYMGHRTILRNAPEPFYAQDPDEQMRAFRQSQAFPRLPPLALVCKDLGKEIVVYYLRHNIFQFHINDKNDYQVFEWLDKVEKLCDTLIPSDGINTYIAAPHLTLRVGFPVRTPISNLEYAIVEYKLIGTLGSRTHDLMDVTLGGALLKECICWVRRGVRATRDTAGFGLQLSDFTLGLQHKVNEFWFARRRESRTCLKCSPPRWGTNIEDTDDEHEDEQTDQADDDENEDEEMVEAGGEVGDGGQDEESDLVVT
ncbi:hypothetical protein LTR22_023976 [Elasticomyces elasticus]|nr:hypothetical protein LTR22_023976 [Elasticomyces elasticus]KAK4906421.1 hypothetical protein LTR49_024443 [Elasticomyces elasticus]KAK5747354.1 hypothetical protein LTS12_022409 [Elasticomyces elasticus]